MSPIGTFRPLLHCSAMSVPGPNSDLSGMSADGRCGGRADIEQATRHPRESRQLKLLTLDCKLLAT